jgi:hypothetical protein
MQAYNAYVKRKAVPYHPYNDVANFIRHGSDAGERSRQAIIIVVIYPLFSREIDSTIFAMIIIMVEIMQIRTTATHFRAFLKECLQHERTKCYFSHRFAAEKPALKTNVAEMSHIPLDYVP